MATKKSIISFLDSLTKATSTINHSHHEIHEGNHFFYDNFVDLAINNVLDIQITTPDSDELLHIIFDINVENETNFFLYEGVNIITPGSDITVLNSRRESSNTSNAVLKRINNVSLVEANNDTDASGATALVSHKTGSGNIESGKARSESELVLKRNTDYSLRFVAVAAGYIDFEIHWYEK